MGPRIFTRAESEALLRQQESTVSTSAHHVAQGVGRLSFEVFFFPLLA